MTAFAHILALTGLSQREAAAFLGVSPSSIDKWSRGARPVPDGVKQTLIDLVDTMDAVADEGADEIERAGVDQVAWVAGDRLADWPSETVAKRVFVFACLRAGQWPAEDA